MTYNLIELKGQQAFEVYCVFKREMILKSNNKAKHSDFNSYTEKDLYKLLSCVKDKNNVPFYENRIKTLKIDKIKELLEFVFNNLNFDFNYNSKFEVKNIEFIDVKSLLLFYVLQRLTIYYYDYSTDRKVNFIDWLRLFKTNILNCQKLIVESCFTDKDFKLLKSFSNNNIEEMDYKEIITEFSNIVYCFLNQDIFFINEIEKIKDFSCDLEIKENSNNLSIQNMLAIIGNKE